MTTRAVILELLRQVTAVKVQPALPAYTTTWRDYISDLIRRVQITGNLRADLDPRATDGIVIVIAMVAGAQDQHSPTRRARPERHRAGQTPLSPLDEARLQQ